MCVCVCSVCLRERESVCVRARETVCQCQWVPVREKSTCVRRVSECVSVCVRERGGGRKE